MSPTPSKPSVADLAIPVPAQPCPTGAGSSLIEPVAAEPSHASASRAAIPPAASCSSPGGGPGAPPSPNDGELLDGLLAGDSAAWETFERRYSRMLRRAIRQNGRWSSDDERDIYCELRARLLANDKSKLRQFDPKRGARLSTWLYEVARNIARDHRRRTRRAALRVARDIDREPASLGPSAYDACLQQERAVLARALVLRLPRSARLFVQLYYVEQMSSAAIARQLGITLATVYSRKCKIEQRLAALVPPPRRPPASATRASGDAGQRGLNEGTNRWM